MPASATEREAAVRAAFADQARWCTELGSPFTAHLCSLVAERLDRSTELGRRVLDWPGEPAGSGDALAIRLCGGLHALVRGGEAPRLAALYPHNPAPSPDVLWASLEPVLANSALLPWIEGAPQTNEVGRSAVLMGGLLAVAERFAQPLELLELGASAGLNLNLDRYAYSLGGLDTGYAASAVRLQPGWKGPPPPVAQVEVAARRGVDLNPVDPRRDAERLLAYVWPDQRERLARLEAALAIAVEAPPPVARGDAAKWLDARLAEKTLPGITRVVLHSVAYQYFPDEAQARIVAAMEGAGARATEAQPLAWLRFELVPGDGKYSLRLRTWPDGEDRLLAWVHPHGTEISWLG